jgi:hypothetical protein
VQKPETETAPPAETGPEPKQENHTREISKMSAEVIEPPKIDEAKIRGEAAKSERERMGEIVAIGDRFGMRDAATAAVLEAFSL